MPNTGSVKSAKAAEKIEGAKKPVKTTKPAKKPAAKRKPAPPKITEQMFEQYFYKLPYTKFIQLTKDWNEVKLKIKLQKHSSYDGWLNYFKTLTPAQIKMLAQTGLDILPTEAYAALSRWHDIISNPGRIDKIHRAGLTNGKSEKTIVDYAKANDRLGVLEALRDELAQKLQQGAGARDAGTLAAQLTEIMTQIEVYKRRLAPKEETALGALMSDIGKITAKRPSENGKGARHTSFASRVTIEDLEAANGKAKK